MFIKNTTGDSDARHTLKAIKEPAADYGLLSYDDDMTFWLLRAPVEMIILWAIEFSKVETMLPLGDVYDVYNTAAAVNFQSKLSIGEKCHIV